MSNPQIVCIDGHLYAGQDCSLDVTGAKDVEIVISNDGRLWINTPACRLRICQIEGEVMIRDNREADNLTSFPVPAYIPPDGCP